jgi:hypothetical protein
MRRRVIESVLKPILRKVLTYIPPVGAPTITADSTLITVDSMGATADGST